MKRMATAEELDQYFNWATKPRRKTDGQHYYIVADEIYKVSCQKNLSCFGFELPLRLQIHHNYSDVVLASSLKGTVWEVLSRCFSGRINSLPPWGGKRGTILFVPDKYSFASQITCFFIWHDIPQTITGQNEALIFFCPRNEHHFRFWDNPRF